LNRTLNFLGCCITMSQKSEPSEKEQSVSWAWKDNKDNWCPYDDTLSSAIEKLRNGAELQTCIGKRTYKIRRISATKGEQKNIHSGCHRFVRRIEKNTGPVVVWQYPGNQEQWYDYPPETSLAIERLQKGGVMEYSAEGRRYQISKIDSNVAIQKNLKSQKQRTLRKVNNGSQQSSITLEEESQNAEKPKEVIDTQSDTSCVVCFEEDRTHILLPCGHFCLCKECAQTLKECPVCRAKVQQVHQVFKA